MFKVNDVISGNVVGKLPVGSIIRDARYNEYVYHRREGDKWAYVHGNARMSFTSDEFGSGEYVLVYLPDNYVQTYSVGDIFYGNEIASLPRRTIFIKTANSRPFQAHEGYAVALDNAITYMFFQFKEDWQGKIMWVPEV